jgi:branched-chain amino acid transport system substrate-binding protein
MSPRRFGAIGALTLGAAALVLAAGCGGKDPVRVGVLVDCTGIVGAAKEQVRAAVTLPLLERGAQVGDAIGEVQGARVAGRPVEIVESCTELTYFSRLITATRELVEDEDVDVVIGPVGTPEGPVMRTLAERYPNVSFILGPGLAQEATLRESQPNLFRFQPDGEQNVAGLGTYAFKELGWRRAVVVAEGYSGGWEHTAGFVAEFCALGGTVVERDYTSLFTPDPSAAATRHARSADGVALFTTFFTPIPYMQTYAAAVKSGLGRRLVISGNGFLWDPNSFAPPRVDTSGVVLSGYVPLDSGDRAMRAYRESFERTFPELPANAAVNPYSVTFYTAMEAVASALEATGGELGDDRIELRSALAGVELDAPQGTVRLDDNGQVIGDIALERIVRTGDGKAELESVRRIEGVDQSFGGLFTPQTPSPSWASPACKKGKPPPWAA